MKDKSMTLKKTFIRKIIKCSFLALAIANSLIFLDFSKTPTFATSGYKYTQFKDSNGDLVITGSGSAYAPTYARLQRYSTSISPPIPHLNDGLEQCNRDLDGKVQLYLSSSTMGYKSICHKGYTSLTANFAAPYQLAAFFNCSSANYATPCRGANAMMYASGLGQNMANLAFGENTPSKNGMAPIINRTLFSDKNQNKISGYTSYSDNGGSHAGHYYLTSFGSTSLQTNFYLTSQILESAKANGGRVILRHAMDDMAYIRVNSSSWYKAQNAQANPSGISQDIDVTNHLRTGNNTIDAIVYDKVYVRPTAPHTDANAFAFYGLFVRREAGSTPTNPTNPPANPKVSCCKKYSGFNPLYQMSSCTGDYAPAGSAICQIPPKPKVECCQTGKGQDNTSSFEESCPSGWHPKGSSQCNPQIWNSIVGAGVTCGDPSVSGGQDGCRSDQRAYQTSDVVASANNKYITFRFSWRLNQQTKLITNHPLRPIIKDPYSSFSQTRDRFYIDTRNQTWLLQIQVKPEDVGKRICRQLSITPSQYNSINNYSPTGTANSSIVCAYVPYNYNINDTTVGIDGGTAPGSQITINQPTINKDKNGSYPHLDATQTKPIQWSLDRFVIPSSGINYNQITTNLGKKFSSGSAACEFYTNPNGPAKATECNKLTGGNTSLTATEQSKAIANNLSYRIPENIPVGTKICFVVSVKPWYDQEITKANRDSWFHGTPNCIVIDKRPKLQVRGGGVLTTGSISTNNTTISGRRHGSWTEYDAVANGPITNFATNSGYLRRTGINSPYFNSLTFANVNNKLGRFSSSNNISHLRSANSSHLSIAGYFSDLNNADKRETVSFRLNNAYLNNLGPKPLNDKFFIIKADRAITITEPLNIPKGRRVVILAKEGIEVKHNINYAQNGIGSIADIPQLILISDRLITIDPGVTKVDAWLVADNNNGNALINTCNQGGNLSAKTCAQQLVVNGPIIANQLKPRRTSFSDTGSELRNINGAWADVALVANQNAIQEANGTIHNTNLPAEIFNFRPDAYLFGYSAASGNNVFKTTSLKELPARY